MKDKHFYTLVGIAGLAVLYLKFKAVEAVENVAEAVDPTNPENAFYTGVNSVGEALTFDEHFTLGGWLFDLTHSEEG